MHPWTENTIKIKAHSVIQGLHPVNLDLTNTQISRKGHFTYL